MDEILHMEQLFTSNETRLFDKTHLASALGKAYENLGEYEKAFLFYEKGNQFVVE